MSEQGLFTPGTGRLQDPNVFGSFQDLTGQISERPDLILQLALLEVGGALGTSHSTYKNELSYHLMKHIKLISQVLGGGVQPYIKSLFLAQKNGRLRKGRTEIVRDITLTFE